MQHTTEITIDLPRNEFIKKLDNTKHMKHWLKGLVSYNFLSGILGQEGAKMELNVKKDYDAKAIHGIQQYYFRDIDLKIPKWVSESKFQLSVFIMKIMAFLMSNTFKKQSISYVKDFKTFAKKGISVAES